MAKKKQYKIDLFEVLNKINKEDYQYFDKLTEEERKELSPYVLQRWLFGAQENEFLHVILTNQYMNPYTFNLQSHKLLLYKLACTANGDIDSTRYSFKKPVKNQQFTKEIEGILNYYQCTVDEAFDMYDLLDSEDLQELQSMYE